MWFSSSSSISCLGLSACSIKPVSISMGVAFCIRYCILSAMSLAAISIFVLFHFMFSSLFLFVLKWFLLRFLRAF